MDSRSDCAEMKGSVSVLVVDLFAIEQRRPRVYKRGCDWN